MTEAKPCLPGCVTTQGRGGDIKSHAPACPNAAPKASEAPEEEPKCLPDCERNCWSGQDKHAYGCPVAALFYLDLKEPAPAPEPKQGSEEPVDWDAAKASSESWAKGRPLPHDLKCTPAQETLGRAYLALRAENERLYGKVQGHGLVLAERDALRVEVERLKKLHSDHCSNPICEGPRS